MFNKKVIIPEVPAHKTLTYADITTKEGFYTVVGRNYPHRIVTLVNSQNEFCTLYCSGVTVQPLLEGFMHNAFLPVEGEEMTITFTQKQ